MKSLFLTQPYLLTLNPSTEMNIVWIQRQPIKGYVEYGRTEKMGCCITAECFEITGLRASSAVTGYADNPEDNPPMQVWQCIAKIENLEPGECVYYRCKLKEEETQIYYFHTAPKRGQPFRFAQMSDLQGIAPCNETVYKIGCQNLDFLLYSGDTVSLSWRADQWFDMEEEWQNREAAKRAFFPSMQQQNGARLMQYVPTFICPGNHELDDLRYGENKEFSLVEENWNWSIFMQMFRPLYPDTDTSSKGRRWYSVNYGDLHITSLSINRWARWKAHEYPGWRLFDSIAPGSPQIEWLKNDLAVADTKFKWVIQHWHILNKGSDVQDNLCQPQLAHDGSVCYPEDHGKLLMEIYENGRVNAVSYGHSHVYERYYVNGTHYIEAAYMSVCYRKENAENHPSGYLPIVEDNSRRSFLIVERREGGLFATGYYANETRDVFDEYQIANENGGSVPASK